MNSFENSSATPDHADNRGEQHASGMANALGKSALSREPLNVTVDGAERVYIPSSRPETFINPKYGEVDITHVDTQPGELPNVVPQERA
jgi:hypothetical protein